MTTAEITFLYRERTTVLATDTAETSGYTIRVGLPTQQAPLVMTPSTGQESGKVHDETFTRSLQRQFQLLQRKFIRELIAAEVIFGPEEASQDEWLALSEASFLFWDNELDAEYDNL